MVLLRRGKLLGREDKPVLVAYQEGYLNLEKKPEKYNLMNCSNLQSFYKKNLI